MQMIQLTDQCGRLIAIPSDHIRSIAEHENGSRVRHVDQGLCETYVRESFADIIQAINGTPVSQNRRLGASVLVFRDPETVLMGFTLNRQRWEFPGGKLDGFETLMMTAHRELKEETSLEITDLLHVGHSEAAKEYCVHFFCGRAGKGMARVMEPEKHKAWVWVNTNDRLHPMNAVAEDIVSRGFVQAARSLLFNPCREIRHVK
jgi:8-oxo-dGTP pyrophosphatase MutT (NUDIX family)